MALKNPFLNAVVAILLSLASQTHANTLQVPADYSAIQSALNAAADGDTVLVSPGNYNESLSFGGKGIRLLSTTGPAQTIIIPPSGDNGVNFTMGETSNAIISGFTISNAYQAVYVSQSSPTIVSNVLLYSATGVYGDFASPTILNNVISNGWGDAIFNGAGSELIEGNLIINNAMVGVWTFAGGQTSIINNIFDGNGGDAITGENGDVRLIIQNIIKSNSGYGINFDLASGAVVIAVNNTIVDNLAGGINLGGYSGSSAAINNIVVGTVAFSGGVIPQFNDFFSYNGDVYAAGDTNVVGANGNISVNPDFVCLPNGDFHLLSNSLCIDAGTNGAFELPSTDFDGNPRILAGTSGSATVDMGAFEFDPANSAIPCLFLIEPSNIVVTAGVGSNSVIVTYPSPIGTPTAAITSSPSSGSAFPPGTNIVTSTLIYGTNVVTATFTVTVLTPPDITNQPSIVEFSAGSTATLSVDVGGTSPFTYQWFFDGSLLGGATNGTLSVSNVQVASEGYYQVKVANNVGTATSLPIVLRATPAAPTIISNPAPLSVSAGSQAILTTSVQGSTPFSFEWFLNGAPLFGASSTQLVISNAQSSNGGGYQVIVSNALGSATSTVATLTVVPSSPSFVLQPAPTSIVAGVTLNLSSLAVGTDDSLNPLTYLWYFQNQLLPGQVQPDLLLTSVTATNQGSYFVVASNNYGLATSIVAQVTVELTPTIISGLSNIIVTSGSALSLSVIAAGAQPLGFLWYSNYTLLTNSSTAVLSNVQPSQSAYYTVVATNAYGTNFSHSRLSVVLPPQPVVAWGDNSGGQLNVPADLTNAVAISGGDFHSVAIRSDGSISAWGLNDDGQTDTPTNAAPFVALAAGASHNLAIVADGSTVAWGRDDAGQIQIPTTVSSPLAVAAGESHSMALLATGQIVVWGDNSFGQRNLPFQLQGVSSATFPWGRVSLPFYPVAAIAAGSEHCLALLTSGRVLGWGDNSAGQALPPATLNGVTAISAGLLHSVALLTNGIVVVWGDNTFGQTNVPAGLSNVVAIAAGALDTTALRSDGTVVVWGDNTYGQTNLPPNISNYFAIASGYYHELALAQPAFVQPLVLSVLPNLVIQWPSTAVLQCAPNITGPFTDVTNATSPFTNNEFTAPSKFFRLRRGF